MWKMIVLVLLDDSSSKRMGIIWLNVSPSHMGSAVFETYLEQLCGSMPDLPTQTRTVIIILRVISLRYSLLECRRIWVRAEIKAF
jgi:hypothetical protein